MKFLYSVIILCLSVIYTNAQDYGAGFRFGLNYSTNSISDIFNNDDSLNNRTLSGLSIAIVFENDLKKYLAFQPEIRYATIETDYQLDTAAQVERGLIFDKIQIPALFKLKIGSDVLKLNGLAGPNFAFITRAFNETRPLDSAEGDVVKDRLDKSTFDNFELNYIAGFGLTMIFNDFSIYADYRYNFDFRNLSSIRQNGFIDNLGSSIGGGLIYYY